MSLVTLHTKLLNVNASAVLLKNQCGYDAAFMADNLISIGALYRMASGYRRDIDDVCAPYAGNTALAAYADQQFVMEFHLLERLAGMEALLLQAINDIATIVQPYTARDLYNDNSVIVDGVMIDIPGYGPDATAALIVTLQTIYDNIPE